MNIIILLVGESGSGKTTIANKLCEERGLKQVFSYTTRPPRYPDEPGHIFVSEEEFDKLENVVAFTRYNKNLYCATEDQVNNSDIYVIDPAGIRYFKETYHGPKKTVIVRLRVDVKHRMYRMLDRGDNFDDVYKRLKTDDECFAEVDECVDYTIDNYDLDVCVNTLWNIIEKENN